MPGDLTSGQRELVERLFGEALLRPTADRAGFIEAAGVDGAVVAEVRRLIADSDTRASMPGATMIRNVLGGSPDRPDRIGPYHVLSLIGEGGFGVVYLAERREPIVQRVALKLIKLGMDTRSVVARFEQERQALAVMDHPNVAKVLDAGTTDDGRPYFVMEHVRGEPITTFCDRHKLTVRQRLELFIPVCEAVQHAHSKGVIHRDIKPNNVLVQAPSERAGAGADSAGVPKVIDFGVAKAISHTLTDKTIFTEQGQIIGTPEYMSPEQAEMGAVDIDTRTDVYSLGVLLYELLSGALPFTAEELRSKGYNEIQRIIREVDPPRPSTRLERLASGAGVPDAVSPGGGSGPGGVPVGIDSAPATIAAKRATNLGVLVRQLRSELDWIPLRAMAKDRTRRYGTPLDLARDLGNYLAGRPLEAGPDSAGYRLRKYARRHRVAIGAACCVALALGAGTLFSTYFALGEAAARRDADAEREQLRLEIGNDQRVERFTSDVTRDLDRARAIGFPIEQVLRVAAARVTSPGAERGELRAMMLLSLARVARDWNLGGEARDLTCSAGDALAEVRFDHPRLLKGFLDAARALVQAGEHARAWTLLDRVDLSRLEGPVQRAAFYLARAEAAAGLKDEASAGANSARALGILSASPGSMQPGAMNVLMGLHRWFSSRSDPRAEDVLRLRIAMQERIVDQMSADQLPMALVELGQYLVDHDRAAEAVPILERALRARVALYGTAEYPGVPATQRLLDRARSAAAAGGSK